MSPDDPRHGTTPGYHAGCRCIACRRAIGRYEKHTKYRRVAGITWAIPAQGAQRRVKALMALGWTGTDIAAAAGWDNRNYVMRVIHGQKGKPCRYIERKTHAAIADAYDRLCMTLPPHTPARARTRSLARKKGYAPPLAWDDIDTDPEPQYGGQDTDIDPVVVMRLLEGQRVKSTPSEKEAAMARWVADGGSRAELCRWHGWKTGRYGAAMRLVRAENDQDLIENEAV